MEPKAQLAEERVWALPGGLNLEGLGVNLLETSPLPHSEENLESEFFFLCLLYPLHPNSCQAYTRHFKIFGDG